MTPSSTHHSAHLDDLLGFLHQSPTPFHAVDQAAARLLAAGFVEVDQGSVFPAGPGARFVRRGGAVVAWRQPGAVPARYLIVGAHTDSPNLRVKPHPDTGRCGLAQLGVEVYGGVLVNSWLDRDLGLAGRVVIQGDGSPREVLFSVAEPVARIPQLAIHLDREINESGLLLNKQTHLAPLWGHGGAGRRDFREWLAHAVACDPTKIMGWDAMFFDVARPALVGVDQEFLASARIDNLLSCHSAIVGLIDADAPGDQVQVVALFDHEEVGSTSDSGANGALLGSILERIGSSCGLGRAEHLAALAVSHCVSADNAHATHPNYPERHEPDHHIAMNGGPVIKVNTSMRYATNAASAAPLLEACEEVGVPVQWFVTRGDMGCGSTIGPATAAQLGVATVDVGVAQLAMHSIREMCGSSDPHRFRAVLARYLS